MSESFSSVAWEPLEDHFQIVEAATALTCAVPFFLATI